MHGNPWINELGRGENRKLLLPQKYFSIIILCFDDTLHCQRQSPGLELVQDWM